MLLDVSLGQQSAVEMPGVVGAGHVAAMRQWGDNFTG